MSEKCGIVLTEAVKYYHKDYWKIGNISPHCLEVVVHQTHQGLRVKIGEDGAIMWVLRPQIGTRQTVISPLSTPSFYFYNNLNSLMLSQSWNN